MIPEYGGMEARAGTDAVGRGELEVRRGLPAVTMGLEEVRRGLVEVRGLPLLVLRLDLFIHFSMCPFNTSRRLNFLPHSWQG